MVLTVIGAGLILAGLVILFGRKHDVDGGETKFKFKDFEIASSKPSLLLICLGSVLVVLPLVLHRDDGGGGGGGGGGGMGPGLNSGQLGNSCCYAGGACPMTLTGPGPMGTPCTCMDMVGNMAVGTVCP